MKRRPELGPGGGRGDEEGERIRRKNGQVADTMLTVLEEMLSGESGLDFDPGDGIEVKATSSGVLVPVVVRSDRDGDAEEG